VSEQLLFRLKQHDCGISPADIIHGTLTKYIHCGLRVLTICNDGSGRSRTVADSLTRDHMIPAARLIGGLHDLTSNEKLRLSQAVLQTMINDCPNVVIILTPEEIALHYAFISNLRALKYSRSDAAIQSILRIES
jgi:hypothetical protein